jgi:hypothetical protein
VTRALWLSPSNIHPEPIIQGLRELARCELTIVWYETYGLAHVDGGVRDMVDAIRPDIVIYTGQNGGIYPNIDTLCRIKQVCPTVLLVHDGSDTTWKRLLHEYRERDAFSTVVNIDGNDNWERGSHDITALTPTAQGFYA